MYKRTIRTQKETEWIDITAIIKEIVHQHGKEARLCTIFVPHTTAGITINENADPDVHHDMSMGLERMVPADQAFRHREGNSHAHIKASLLGSSVTVIIDQGSLQLGTWQGIYLAEFDGPRQRQVYIQLL
ncbi:MAG TPA: YjbQ family protein [Syntrophomonadaceae bacterium]|jgi:secondary thiamine-phosphate synthase enzyme|nr:YjbQ family protein [Syntrophomonadaceae bacterium]